MPEEKPKKQLKRPAKVIDHLDRRLKINKEEALHLKVDHGLTYKEIGELTGASKQAVHQAIAPLLGDRKEIDAFKENRADIFAGKQKELLLALDADRLQKMSGRDLVIATGVLFDKERLERGQSTVNLASIYSQALEQRGDVPQDVVLDAVSDDDKSKDDG